MNLIDKLAWILINNKSILSTRSFGKDKFYIPGGKREPGESDVEALCREIKEELCVDLLIDTVQFVGEFQAQAHGRPDGKMVKMTCYMADYNGELMAASEIEEIKWLTYADQDQISHVDKLIFEYLKGKDLIC